MSKIVKYSLFFLLFYSCNDKVKLKDHDISKILLNDSIMQYNKNNILTKKIIRIDDSLYKQFDYNSKGNLNSYGLLNKDSLKTGTWLYYNSLGNSIKKEKYLIVKNNSILNERILFKDNGDTLFNKSKYFLLSLRKDTVKVNEMIKGVIYLEANLFKNKKSSIQVLLSVDDQDDLLYDFSNENSVKLDTFPNISGDKEMSVFFENFNSKLVSIFGKRFNSSGNKIIRGIIVEKYTETLDSAITNSNKTYFEKEVYIEDGSSR